MLKKNRKRPVRPCCRVWLVLNMCDWLPKEIQEIVKQRVWLANPMSSPVYRDTDMMRRYEDHERNLRACGHDTQEFAAAIERARAAIRELDHVNEFMYEQFKQDPFPFIRKVDADFVLDVKRALKEQLSKINEGNAERIAEMKKFNDEYAAKRDELSKGKYNGYELEGADPPYSS